MQTASQGEFIYKFLDNVFAHMDEFMQDQSNDAETRTFVTKFLVARFPDVNTNDLRQAVNRNSKADVWARVAWKYGASRGVTGTPVGFEGFHFRMRDVSDASII